MTVSTSTLATFLDMHYDVLVLIVSHMSRIDLLSVMGACRTLHSMLVPHLLAISHNLRRTNQLVSFCHFMLDDKPLRFLYLRDLTISLTFVSSPLLSDLLAKVLRQACKLQGLGLHCGILEGDSRISEAIAAHTGLRKLSLRYPGSGARQMLICMQSPIEVVEVIMSEASEGGIVDPGSLLTGFCSTLTSLSATLARFSTTGIQYPHLTTLELNCCNNLDIGPLIHLFPNVRNLKIVTCQGLCSHHEHNSQAVIVDESDVKLHRLSNLVVQSELLLQWRTLEYVQGDLPNLYCLAIRGSIRRLDIISADAGNADKLPAILTDLHPSSLFLDVNSDFYQDLPELLQEATKGVCALLLIINKRSTFEEMKRLMECVLGATSSLTHTFFRFKSLPPSISFEKNYHKKLDLDKLSQRAMLKIPPLQYISLEWNKHPPLFWRICRIERHSEGKVLEALPAEVGAKVMAEVGF